MTKRSIWTCWDWQREPEAPRGWEHPEQMVVVVDGWLSVLEHHPDAETSLTAFAHLDIRHRPPLICIEDVDGLRALKEVGAGAIPALRIERQADLSSATLRALVGAKAAHRALVITPREEIDLDPPTCPSCGGQDAVPGELPHDGTLFCRECSDEMAFNAIIDPFAVENRIPADMVIARGPVGPDAWPMHPAWVRKLRDQCAEAGVPFAFLGWGTWKPISEAVPQDARVARTVRGVWRFREGDPDDLPLLTYEVGPERSGRTIDDVEHIDLPEGI